jgi:hypothetical protein
MTFNSQSKHAHSNFEQSGWFGAHGEPQSGLLRFHWVDFPLTSQLLSFWRLTLNEGIRGNVNLETVSGGYF